MADEPGEHTTAEPKVNWVFFEGTRNYDIETERMLREEDREEERKAKAKSKAARKRQMEERRTARAREKQKEQAMAGIHPQLLFQQSDVHKRFGLAQDSEDHNSQRKTDAEEDDELTHDQDETCWANGLSEKMIISEQPELINASMHSYQIAGLNWLANLYEHKISGILADEAGLGKKLQCISLLCWLRETKNLPGPFLVLAPTSRLRKWRESFEKWAPVFKVLLVDVQDESECKRLFDDALRGSMFNVCIASSTTVIRTRAPALVRKFPWNYVIVDEPRRMENNFGELSRVLAVKADLRHPRKVVFVVLAHLIS